MKKYLFYLILPDIRSCHNVGAMFRTADATGVTKLFLVGYTAEPPKIQIDKVSLGAETWMPWEHRDSLLEVVQELKDQGVHIIALEQDKKSIELSDYTLPKKPIALIVGNEVDGVDKDILHFCDDILHINMQGKKESLNVSIAAGIAMYVLGKA